MTNRETLLNKAMQQYDTPKARAAREASKKREARAAGRREARKELAREIELEAERIGAVRLTKDLTELDIE